MLDDAHWPATSALIDDACGTKGNELVVGEGFGDDAKVHSPGSTIAVNAARTWSAPTSQVYYPWDERLPRLRQLPDSRLVHVTELYTDQELKTSPTYNEAMHRSSTQNGLKRAPGRAGRLPYRLGACRPHRSPGGWGSGSGRADRAASAPYPPVRARPPGDSRRPRRWAPPSAISSATRRSASFIWTGAGRIVEMNARARCPPAARRRVVRPRRFSACPPVGGRHSVWSGCWGVRLPTFMGRAPASGSMTVRRSPGMPRLVVHISPVGVRQTDFGGPARCGAGAGGGSGAAAKDRSRAGGGDPGPDAGGEPGGGLAGGRQDGTRHCGGDGPPGNLLRPLASQAISSTSRASRARRAWCGWCCRWPSFRGLVADWRQRRLLHFPPVSALFLSPPQIFRDRIDLRC